MKQAGYSKRPQGRTSDRHRSSPRHAYGEPTDGKVRGNPQQCVEKFLNLAREAATSGDPVAAESYYQYADHYHRLTLVNRVPPPPPRPHTPERQEARAEKRPVPVETLLK